MSNKTTLKPYKALIPYSWLRIHDTYVKGSNIKHGPCRCGHWDKEEYDFIFLLLIILVFQTPQVEYFIVISRFRIPILKIIIGHFESHVSCCIYP